MKKERQFKKIKISGKQEKKILEGHPWVYEDEITEMPEDIENGSLVDVIGKKNQYLGTGLYSAYSKIRVRILQKNANETFEAPFFERRVRYALAFRKEIMPEDFSCCRLIHGESDGLPGVTVDRYEDILVSEIASFPMEARKEIIYASLLRYFEEEGTPIRGIYERNESELRKKEGLPQYKGWFPLPGKTTPESCCTVITENGLQFEIDVENGQKTGYFLDQKYNRAAIQKICSGRKVLECCTHTGSFALNAVKGGAAFVEAMDISETALEGARRNAVLNGMGKRITFSQGDVFEVLQQKALNKEKYDVVILDPPAFTKSRRTFMNARKGYLRANTLAMRVTKRGGYLASCSCSHFMGRDDFMEMLKEAAISADVRLKIVEERHASPDHPVMIGIPETDYLKFFLVQVI